MNTAKGIRMTAPDLERIPGVYNYCDSWCVRCPLTMRCAVYAVDIATGMFGGDSEAALELVLLPPPPMTAEEERRREAFLEAMEVPEPTEADVEELAREEEARRERVDETAAVTASIEASLLMDAWFDAHDTAETTVSGPAAEALQVARWDRHLIPTKVRRALRGLDEYRRGETADDDPVQNDWNGTAKLVLLCIRRSIEAWDTLAEDRADADARMVAGRLRVLQAEMERTFPKASRFIRPGFDEMTSR
jgi:hypothetical protein